MFTKKRMFLHGVVIVFALLCAACSQPLAGLNDPTPTPSPTPWPTPAPQSIYVNPHISLGTISPYVYGANYGPWMSIPLALQEEARQSGITFLRFPGGNWGDTHTLKPYHIDGLMMVSEMLGGAELSISVRFLDSTPEEAVEVMRYVKEQGYQVRYWSIGNEPSLYDEYDTERFNREWRAFAEAMRAFDPDIVLMGPEIHQYTGNPATDPRDAQGRLWMEEFLRANGDLIDIVSFHRYPFPRSMTDPEATPDELLANSEEWDHIIPTLRQTVRDLTGRDLPIAVTEVNSYWSNTSSGETTPDSFYSALWWADVLGRLIREDVEIVAYFALQTPTSIGGYGLLARTDVRPTYYVYQLYKQFGDERVQAETDVPRLSAYAARRADGALTLIVVNRAADAQRVPLQIVGVEQATAEVWLFDRAHTAEQVASVTLQSGQAVDIPGEAVVLYVIHPE